MPGYLMNMMVLIDTDNWLGQIIDKLGRKDKKGAESKIFDLASQAYKYLHFGYDAPTENFPEVSPADIKNNIGSGITQYAFMGAIGPDFPAAGNILALNHGWVAATMHIGAPRHSLKKAGSTEFVKNCIRSDVVTAAVKAVEDNKVPPQTLVNEYKKPIMAYLLGHLSSIATHVLVGPFANQWAWSDDNRNRLEFAVQLDAQIAQGYFQRDDLHSGQTWTAYLPDIGYIFNRHPKGVQLITELYQRGFQKTYGKDGDANPREDLSNFPKALAAAKLPPIENKKLREALDGVYTGYGNILKDSTDDDHIEDAIDSVKGLKALLLDYEAKTPDVGPDLADDLGPDPNVVDPDPPFLIDGYRNTRNWALGWGYDHTPSLPWPPWRFSIIMSLGVLYGSIGPLLDLGVTEDVWGEVISNDVEIDSSGKVTKTTDKLDHWIQHGMFANHLMWHDALDKSYSASGSILWLFNSVLSGVQICDIWQTGRGTTPGKGASKGESKGKEITAGIATPAVMATFEGLTVGLGGGVGEGFLLGGITGGVFGLITTLAAVAKAKRLTDGIFGEGTDSWKDWWLIRKGKWWFKLANFLKSPGFSPPINGWLDFLDGLFDKTSDTVAEVWTWISLAIDIAGDATETLYFEHEDAPKGQEGDRLQRQLWFMQWWMTGAYFLSSLLVFGVKAADDPRSNDHLDKDLHGRDYLLSLIFPVLLIAYKVWYAGGFEGELLKSITGIDWPSTDTDKVKDTILPIEKDATGRNTWSASRAQALPVRVFSDKEVMKPTKLFGSDNTYYPQDEAEDIPWDDIPKRDEQERARKSKSTPQTYTLKDILEKAKFFSGILAMAAVNYDNSIDKECAQQIFRDWNLDHRTDDEWNELMETKPDGTPGWLKAAQQWWEAISQGKDADPSAVLQMEIALGLRCGPVQMTGQLEDRTVAPNNDKKDTAHIPLPNTTFKIVDSGGNVVKTDTTDKDGNFSFELDKPGDYELQVDGYQGIQWTNQGSC
jgi:hypothetical protein